MNVSGFAMGCTNIPRSHKASQTLGYYLAVWSLQHINHWDKSILCNYQIASDRLQLFSLMQLMSITVSEVLRLLNWLESSK